MQQILIIHIFNIYVYEKSNDVIRFLLCGSNSLHNLRCFLRGKIYHYCHQHIRKPLHKPFAAVADKEKYLPPNCNRAIATRS